MSTGPRECSDPQHRHVLMCPQQATNIAMAVVMAGMARREDGIGNAWWMLGLNELRYVDAEEAVRWLVSGGIGDRSWITARDVIRRVRTVRAERHAKVPEPVPPHALMPAEGEEDTAELGEKRRAFIRWYYTAVGNGEEPRQALEMASSAVGVDRYIEARPPVPEEPAGPGDIEAVRRVIEASRKKR